jgi:hypothetical protein
MTIPTVSVNRLWFGIALACLVSGCINRPGMNAECRWPAEPSRSLDPRNVADVRHLRGDLEVADELVIRYRDEKGGRRPRSILGIQVRTGASGRPRDADAAECRGRLNASIASVHNVSSDQIATGRSQLANRGWDLSVTLPVLVFYAVVARVAQRRLNREFREGGVAARMIATLVVSIAVAVVVVIVGGLWSGISEIVRVGNEHLSFRASRIAWASRAPVWFVLTMVGFWVAKAWSAKRATAKPAG